MSETARTSPSTRNPEEMDMREVDGEEEAAGAVGEEGVGRGWIR